MVLIIFFQGIIKCVTGMTIHCSSMWWPANSLGGVLNTMCFMSLSGLTLYNFLSAMFHGPGYLQLNWNPVSRIRLFVFLVIVLYFYCRKKRRI